MPRPRLRRWVRFQPEITHFKPEGVKISSMNETMLTFGEFEAVRLKDYENLDQTEAAKKMKISQPTLNRLLKEARKKIADAIVNGKAIKIQGGNYKMVQRPGERIGAGMSRGTGRGMGLGGSGRGRMGGPFAAGPGGLCKCPKCSHEQTHPRGVPCNQTKCQKCGSVMARG